MIMIMAFGHKIKEKINQERVGEINDPCNVYDLAKGKDFVLLVKEVGGFPNLSSTSTLLDTDNDGMPDSWEITNGLDINDPADRNYLNGEGYTNLELYLNGFTIKAAISTKCLFTLCNKLEQFLLVSTIPTSIDFTRLKSSFLEIQIKYLSIK